MSLSHEQARRWIETGADGAIQSHQQAELDRHLEGCAECRAFAESTRVLDERLARVLRRRWPLPAHSNQETSWVARNVKARTVGQRPASRIASQILRPAASFGALAALLAAMAWALGGIANPPASDETATVEATPSAIGTQVAEGSSTPAACEAQFSARTDALEKPRLDAAVVGMLEIGQTASVIGQYLSPDGSGEWLLVARAVGSGWIAYSETATIAGDCSQLPLFVDGTPPDELVTVTPTPPALQPQPTSTPPAPPSGTTTPVCDVVSPNDTTFLRSGPGEGYPVIGALPSGAQIPVLAWAPGEGSTTWLNVGYNGVSSGWVAWQNVDMTQLCAFIPAILPTPTSSEPCVAEALTDTPAHSGPATTYPLVAVLPIGASAPIVGIYTPPNYSLWYQVEYQGSLVWLPAALNDAPLVGYKGNCDSMPSIDFQPAPPTFTPSATWEVTPTVTPLPTSMNCTGSVNVDGLAVYASPAFSASVFGTLAQGSTVTIVGAYYGGDSNNWFQIAYQGGTGWIISEHTVTLHVNCGNIPPTPVVSYSVPIDYTASVGLDIGATSQFSQSLPGGNGDRAHVIAVKVEGIPAGNSDTSYYRTVRVHVGCAGPSANTLRWGYFGTGGLAWSCGQYIDVNMGMGWDSQYYIIQIPPDGSATYTITLTVGPYAGP